jgi:hypothetical protein
MVFGVFVGLVVACASSAAESAARLIGRPVRWIWSAGVAITLIIVAAAPFRRAPGVTGVNAPLFAHQTSGAVVATPAHASFTARLLGEAGALSAGALRAVEHVLPPASGGYLLGAWIIASLLLATLFIAVHVRMRVARRRWPRAELHGTSVCLAPDAGPAVFGLLRPQIVVPRWLLSRASDEQRLVVAHEAEHIRAGDHLLLAAGSIAVVLLPWNPAVWWMLSRLRLAIELDCDARVLGTGVAPRSYGELLIDLAEQSSGFRLGAPALTDGSSHLKSRVMAMQPKARKFARLRGSLVGFAALSLLVVACEAKLPTSAEIDQMDVAGAEKAAVQAMASSKTAEYRIDGVVSTAEQAHALRPEQIATMNVSQSDGSGSGHNIIRITTHDAAQPVALRRRTVDTTALRKRLGDTFNGLLVVDGSIVDPAVLSKIDPDHIASIDVLKGTAARALYPADSAAANGVIRVITKKVGPN